MKSILSNCFTHYVVLYRYRIDNDCIALIQFTTFDRAYFNKELKRMRKSNSHSIVNVSVVNLPVKIFSEKRFENISAL